MAARIIFWICIALWISIIFLFQSLHVTPIIFLFISIVFLIGSISTKIVAKIDDTVSRGVLIVLLVVYILGNFTIAVWYHGIFNNVSDLSGAVFASWIANLAFFVFLGVVGLIASTSLPEKLPFESRARIFLGGGRGEHIDFHINEMKEHARFFGESGSIDITLERFDRANDIIFIKEDFRTNVRSFIPDQSRNYLVVCKYAKLTLAPMGAQATRVVFKNSNGPAPHPPASPDSEGNIKEQYFVPINKMNFAPVHYILSCCIRNKTEVNNQRLVRFTLEFLLSITNETGLPIKICFTEVMSGAEINSGFIKILQHGEAFSTPFHNIRPGQNVYSMTYEALDESQPNP